MLAWIERNSVWPRLVAAMLGLASIAVFGARPAAAAVELTLGQSTDPIQIVVDITGVIERGDGQRVQAFLAVLPAGRQVTVNFHSPGGSIEEALRIGRHFHANRVRTAVVGKDRICLSACALAFLGGRDATGRDYRLKGVQAQLGFHSFKRVVPDKAFTVADMKEAVASTQHLLLAIADYLATVGADIEFMSLMLETPSTDMHYLPNNKAPTVGIYVLDEATGRLTDPVGGSR